jgi:predicted  nucleic acid-binding Zn-ribbon protein
MTMVDYERRIEEWKQIACDKNIRIQSLENELNECRKALKQMTAERDELKRELRLSSMAFEAVDRERVSLKKELQERSND